MRWAGVGPTLERGKREGCGTAAPTITPTATLVRSCSWSDRGKKKAISYMGLPGLWPNRREFYAVCGQTEEEAMWSVVKPEFSVLLRKKTKLHD